MTTYYTEFSDIRDICFVNIQGVLITVLLINLMEYCEEKFIHILQNELFEKIKGEIVIAKGKLFFEITIKTGLRCF